MSMDETPWTCRDCRRVLGLRGRKTVTVEGRERKMEILTVGDVELIGFGRVTCSCGAVRVWQPGEAAMQALVEMVQRVRIPG